MHLYIHLHKDIGVINVFHSLLHCCTTLSIYIYILPYISQILSLLLPILSTSFVSYFFIFLYFSIPLLPIFSSSLIIPISILCFDVFLLINFLCILLLCSAITQRITCILHITVVALVG